MEGLLKPVGPESPRTYWIRRAAIAVVLAIVAFLVAIAILRPGAESPQQAVPAAPVSPTPVDLAPPDPSPTPSASASPGASASPSPGAEDSASPSASASASASPDPSASPAPSPGSDSSAGPSASPSARNPEAAADSDQSACAPEDLRLDLRGGTDPGLRRSQDFSVDVTNVGERTCSLAMTDQNFELRVFSGSDRIWSSQDCDAWFEAPAATELEDGDKVTTSVTWPGERSDGSCSPDGGPLGTGTYVATAEMDGVDPAQRVMRLR